MNWLDRAFTNSAVAFSQKFSRRRFMWRAATGVAGSSFLALFAKSALVLINSPAPAQAAGTCTSVNHCGMGGYNCAGMANSSEGCDCSNCLGPNGCPYDSSPLQEWTACCPCAEDPAKGRRVKYVDCCGSKNRDKCPGKCRPDRGPYGTGIGDCYEPGMMGQAWCAPILCTMIVPTTECCQTATPASNCTW